MSGKHMSSGSTNSRDSRAGKIEKTSPQKMDSEREQTAPQNSSAISNGISYLASSQTSQGSQSLQKGLSNSNSNKHSAGPVDKNGKPLFDPEPPKSKFMPKHSTSGPGSLFKPGLQKKKTGSQSESGASSSNESEYEDDDDDIMKKMNLAAQKAEVKKSGQQTLKISPKKIEVEGTSKSSKVQTVIVARDTILGEGFGRLEDNYSLMDPPLGSGCFGTVYKATHLKSGLLRAVKKIKLASLGTEAKETMLKDFNILKCLSHPNIVSVHEYFQDEEFLYIVTEYCGGGELFDRIASMKRFTEVMAAEYLIQILSAISYCHERNLVHCDIKPENVVFSSIDSNVLKLIDFGNSAFLGPEKLLTNMFGTAYYIAPEVLQGKYNEKCDIWSIGVVLYIFLSGYPPFNGNSDREILANVVNHRYNFNKPVWQTISADTKELITKMLTFSPANRPSAKECLKDPWIVRMQNYGSMVEPPISSESLRALKHFRAGCKLQEAVLFYLSIGLSTEEEKAELFQAFAALDKDNDGKISVEDLLKACKKLGKDQSESEGLVAGILDKNASGDKSYIEWDQFMKAVFSRRQYITDQKLKAAFFYFDTDGDGNITTDDLKAVLGKGMPGMEEEVWEQILTEALGEGGDPMNYEKFKELMENFKRNETITQSLNSQKPGY